MFKKIRRLQFRKIVIFALIFSMGVAVGFGYFTNTQKTQLKSQIEKNTPKAFLSEIYDKIKDNYWDNLSEGQILDLFRLSLEKNAGRPTLVKINSRQELLHLLDSITKGLNEEKRKQFVVNSAVAVLNSLNPPGRSGLLTEKQEEQLKNTVENINPEKDLYKDLGLSKGASEAQVKEAYQKKYEELKKESSPPAQEQLKTLTYARDVLTEKDTKQRYDKGGVEPTIFIRLIAPNILYLQFKKFSPATLDEFQISLNSYKDVLGLEALIFDLRGNVGGAIDSTAYFLGFFLGKNQYAFDFYKKGEYIPFKTPTDKLSVISKFRQIVILVDNQTQSSAEMMAATLKKYNVGVVVGVPTRGWGTVERVFPLDNQISQKEKYSLFLVHSITLRDDNQPIEGRGVEPNVNIKDANWETQLFSYFRNPQLTLAVKHVLSNPD